MLGPSKSELKHLKQMKRPSLVCNDIEDDLPEETKMLEGS